jgi:hypothetical protein
MRTTENLTIALPPAIKRDMERAAKRENRTVGELISETWQQHRRSSDDDIYERIRKIAPPHPAMQAIRDEARRNGTDKLTMAQIQREVRAVRRQQDRKNSGRAAK